MTEIHFDDFQNRRITISGMLRSITRYDILLASLVGFVLPGRSWS